MVAAERLRRLIKIEQCCASVMAAVNQAKWRTWGRGEDGGTGGKPGRFNLAAVHSSWDKTRAWTASAAVWYPACLPTLRAAKRHTHKSRLKLPTDPFSPTGQDLGHHLAP